MRSEATQPWLNLPALPWAIGETGFFATGPHNTNGSPPFGDDFYLPKNDPTVRAVAPGNITTGTSRYYCAVLKEYVNGNYTRETLDSDPSIQIDYWHLASWAKASGHVNTGDSSRYRWSERDRRMR